jgi:alkylation response protein AidB-like acyl-CoA dehydrogenase
MHPAVERAQQIADDVLFPAALKTDVADLVPVASLGLLAREGLYGIAGPVEAGGLGLDVATTYEVIEALAGGCLSTTFVWIQHHSAVRAVARSETPGLREGWLARLCRGEVRAGIARAGELPGPPMLRATRTSDGLVLDGDAPWVTGWGRIDVMLVAAREGDMIVRALVDAVPGPTLSAERLHLVGTDASGTFTLTFRDHQVPLTRIVETEPHAVVLARDPSTLRTNGSLALGVASRCCRVLGPTDLDDELTAVRWALDRGTPETLPAARAHASEFAMRAATALTVGQGGRAILTDHHAQRLAREALFLLVFGSRASIRDELMARLTRSHA